MIKENKINKKLIKWCLLNLEKNNKSTDQFVDLKKLSIIIPSYNRQEFLLRQMVYWKDTMSEVFIVDESKESLPDEIVNKFNKITGKFYFHLNLDIYKRLNFLVNKVSKPYQVLLGDDEFHLKNGLVKAIKFLDQNSHYSACIGQSLKYYISKNYKKITYDRGYKHFGYQINSDKIALRLKTAFTNYNSATSYSIHRKELWKKAWGDMQKTSCKDTAEVEQACKVYISGKFKSIDEVYWLRSYENLSINDGNEYKDLSFNDWINKKQFSEEKEIFITRLSEFLSKRNSTNIIDSRKIIQEALNVFNDFYKKNNLRTNLFNTAWYKGLIVYLLKNILSKNVYLRLKNFLFKNKELKSGNLGDINNLQNNELKKYFTFDKQTFDELRKVEKIILEFYQNR